MNSKPLISIIIPFYNPPVNAFKRCINSLVAQSNGDFEAVIINDGSKSDYNRILKETVETDKRIRLINKDNEGSAIARNIGIGEARGEYIMFLDSDDAITEYCLEEAAEAVKTCKSDLVIGTVMKISEEEIEYLRPVKNSDLKLLTIGPDKVRESLVEHMIGLLDDTFSLQKGYIADGPVAKLLRKSIAEKVLFSKESFWNDDTIWNLQVLKNCENITIVYDLWYKYLINSNSKTRKFRPNCPYEFVYRTKQELDLMKELWPNCMEGIYNRIFNDITILGRTFLFHPDNPETWLKKYKIYKDCIHQAAYREALEGLNLNREKRFLHKIAKELLRYTAYYGPHIISYWILALFYHIRKNEL